MREDQLLALLKLDWSRLRRGFLLLGAVLGITVAYLLATHRLSVENAVVFGMGFSIGPLFSIGLLGIRDRLEGTLALLASLPVSSGVLAALRLSSLALLVLPLALVDGVLFALTLPQIGLPPSAALGLALSVWIGLASTSLWLAAVSIAFPPQKASTTLSVVFLAFMGSMMVLDDFFPTPAELIQSLLDPANATTFGVVLAAMVILSAAGAWALTAWGIRNYSMEAERPG